MKRSELSPEIFNDARSAYQCNGYYVTPKIVDEDLLEKASLAQDTFYKDTACGWPFKRVAPIGWKTSDSSKLRKNDFVSFRIKEFMDLVLNPLIGEYARQLCGEDVRLFQDQLCYKTPDDHQNETSMGWHNDRQYWQACTSEKMLTAWIPFEDITLEMGPITYLRGSHKWEQIQGLDFFSTDFKSLEEKIHNNQREIVKDVMVLKRGQVCFHHCKTIHGSGPNLSTRPRRSLAVHLQPITNMAVSNKYHIAKTLEAELGGRDFSHPQLFPLLRNLQ